MQVFGNVLSQDTIIGILACRSSKNVSTQVSKSFGVLGHYLSHEESPLEKKIFLLCLHPTKVLTTHNIAYFSLIILMLELTEDLL